MKRIVSALLILILLVGVVTLSVSAKGTCGTAATDLIDSNVSGSNVYRRTARSWSYLHPLPGGGMMTLIYLKQSQRIEVSYYSSDFEIQKTLSITPELPVWGGFYATDDAYYLFTGQENEGESPDVEVMRVTKYTTAWERVGQTSLYDVNIVYPYSAGQVRCAVTGNIMVVHTAREMYAIDGVIHQSNFTFTINTDTMETLEYRAAMTDGIGFVSHSFDQYIYYDGEKFVTVDHGDSFPRAVVLNEFYPATFKVAGKIYSQKSANFLKMPGEGGDNDTGISTGGFAVSPTSYILVGTSRLNDLNNPTLRSRPYNVFVSVMNRKTYQVTQYELTDITKAANDHTGFVSGEQAYTPYIVKISDSEFMVIWKIVDQDTVYYQKLNGDGKPVGEVYSIPGKLSYVEPQVINGKVTWYSYKHNEITFYTISTSNWKDTAVKTLNNSHTLYVKTDAQNHWFQCGDCGYTTTKSAHETVNVFSSEGTWDTKCKTCSFVVKSDPVQVNITEGVSDSGGQKLQLSLKTASGTKLTSNDLTLARTSTSYTYVNGKTIAHKATYKFTNKGDEKGSFSRTFYRLPSVAGVVDIAPQGYTGKAITPSVEVKENGTVLTEGKDYTLSYQNNTKVGTATVTVTGIGNYFGTIEKTFAIIEGISGAKISGISSKTYTGSAITQNPKVVLNGKVLQNGTDYTLSYKNNTRVGTATVIITGKGAYAGSVSKKFQITKQSVKDCKVKLSTTSYTYNGNAKTPSVTVKNEAGKTLKKGTDYTVTYAKGRKNVGTYKVTVKMKGNYTGTKVLTFKVRPVSVSNCKVKLSTTSYTYNGKVKTPSVVVKDSAGKTLKKGTDYTVTYAKGRKNVGTYKVAVKMKGNYTGTKTLTFKIIPKAASIKKLTAKTKAFTVSINRVTTQATGYQVQYATSKTFSKATTETVKSYKSSTLTLKKLKSNKKYYVRIRTYKTVGGSKVYSNWSAVKTVKTR